MVSTEHDNELPEISTRRSLLAAVISALLGLIPASLAGGFLLSPLWNRERSGEGGEDFVPLDLPLDAVPSDGTPILVTVTRDQQNAWNLYPDNPVGNVWLRRVNDSLVAFSTICPHLGCAVEHRSSNGDFFCPCHNSNFALDGTRLNQIPPRDLDSLETKIVDGDIWIRYRSFRAGTAEKIEV